MKNIIKTLTVVTTLLTSMSSFAYDEFRSQNDHFPVCNTEEVAMMLAEKTARFDTRPNPVINRECTQFSGKLKFEITGKNSYIARVNFYHPQTGQLDNSRDFYIQLYSVKQKQDKAIDVYKHNPYGNGQPTFKVAEPNSNKPQAKQQSQSQPIPLKQYGLRTNIKEDEIVACEKLEDLQKYLSTGKADPVACMVGYDGQFKVLKVDNVVSRIQYLTASGELDAGGSLLIPTSILDTNPEGTATIKQHVGNASEIDSQEVGD